MRTLFLRIDSTATEAVWQCADKGQPVGPIGRGRLSQALRLAHSSHVVVLVPSEDIFLTQIELPGRNRQKLLKAVPFAVEDQIINDPEEMHFALSSQAERGRYTVAAVEDKLIEYWRAQLRAAGIRAEVMAPDVFGLPAGEWSILLETQRALVRTPYNLFATELDNLPVMLRNALEQAGADKPSEIMVYDSGRANQSALLQANFDDVRFNVRPMTEGFFGLIIEHYQPRGGINLLQGDYSVERNLKKYFKPWVTTATLFLIWLAWQLTFNVVEYLKLHQQSKSLSEQLAKLHKDALPSKQKPADTSERKDMERYLKEMRKSKGGGSSGFAEMMNKIAPALKQVQGLGIKKLHYYEGKLDLELNVQFSNQVDQIKQQLETSTGWSVEIASANTRGDVTEVRLQIKRNT